MKCDRENDSDRFFTMSDHQPLIWEREMVRGVFSRPRKGNEIPFPLLQHEL